MNLIKLGRQLFPLNRSLTGQGVNQTLKILKNYNNKLKVINFKSGKKVFDWTIPKVWVVNEAWIKNDFGDMSPDDFSSWDDKNNTIIQSTQGPKLKKYMDQFYKERLISKNVHQNIKFINTL